MMFKKSILFLLFITVTFKIFTYDIVSWEESSVDRGFYVYMTATTTVPGSQISKKSDTEYYFHGKNLDLDVKKSNVVSVNKTKVFVAEGDIINATDGARIVRTFKLENYETWAVVGVPPWKSGWKERGSHEITFIADDTSPVVMVDSVAMDTFSKTSDNLHLSGNILYFSPSYPGQLQLIGSYPTDSGSGYDGAVPKKTSGIPKTRSSSITLSATDNVGNKGFSKPFEFVYDNTGPTFNMSAISYLANSDTTKNSYEISVTYNNFYDQHSGFKSLQKELDGKAVTIKEINGVCTIPNLERDKIYSYKSYAVDNVMNKSTENNHTVLLSAAARISDNTDYDLVYDAQGNLHYKGTLDFGSYANHATHGIESVNLSINGYSLGSVNLSGIINNKLPFDFIVSSAAGVKPHKIYEVKVTTKHKNQISEERTFYSDPVKNRTVEGLDKKIVISGKSLSLESSVSYTGAVGDTVFDVIRSLKGDIVTLFTPADSFFIENYNTVTDSDGDKLNFISSVSNGNPVFKKVTVDGYDYIVFTESYYEDVLSESSVLTGVKGNYVNHNYLLSGYRYKQDNFINAIGIEIDIANSGYDKIEKTNSPGIKLRVTSLPDETGYSGNSSIVFFETDSYIPGTDQIRLDSAYKASSNRVVTNVNTNWYDLTCKNINHLTSETGDKVYVSARLEDNAGNFIYLPTKSFIYDNNAPDRVLIKDYETIRTDSHGIRYSYSDRAADRDVITLTLDRDLIGNNEEIFEASTDSEFCTDIVISGNSISISLDRNHLSYKNNIPVNIDITLKDDAGNFTLNKLFFYTPSQVHDGDVLIKNYENRTFDSWDEERGNVIDFFPGSKPDFDLVNIYRIVNGVQGPIIPYEDINLKSHGTYSYRIKSINGSGFENNKNGFWYDKDIIVGNNSPLLTIDEKKFVTAEKEGETRLFLGPKSSLYYSVQDHDIHDKHQVYFYINEDFAFDYNEEKKSYLSLADVYKNKTRRLINNSSYTFKLGVKDSWGSDPVMEGLEISKEQSFIYDDDAPKLLSSMFEKEEGFSHVAGDLYINVYDAGVGLKEVKAFVNDSKGRELIVTELSKNADYTHKISLIEGEYNIVIHAEDRLANITPVALMDLPIKVDHFAPSVSSVKWGENSNLNISENLLSTKISNFIINWSDSVSTPSEVLYTIMNQGESVYRSIIDVRGKSSGLTDSDLSVSLTNSAGSILENSDYSFLFKIKDSAGNISKEYTLPFTVRYDLNRPVMEFKSWDVFTKSGIDYVNTPVLKAPVIDITDNVDKDISPLYRIQGQDYSTIEDIVLEKEGPYNLHIIGRDKSGHTSEIVLPFEYDITPPQFLNIRFNSEKKSVYKGGETVQINLEGEGVENYYYQLIDSVSKKVLTKSYPEASEGWVQVKEVSSDFYGLILPRVEGIDTHTVLIRLKASDRANNFTEVLIPPEGNFHIDNTGEYINVAIQPWVGKNRKLYARWTYYYDKNSDDTVVNSYNYRLYKRDNTGNTLLEEGTLEKDYLETAIIGDSLETDKYYLEVSAILSSGRESDIFTSIFSFNDFTDPEILFVKTDMYACSENLNIQWNSYDNSGISHIEAVVSWFRYNNGILEKEHSKPLSLGHENIGYAELSKLFDVNNIKNGDKVEITLIAEDLAGNISQKDSEIIIIDNTPPNRFEVVDSGDYINLDLNSYYFEWLWSYDDRESPIERVQYQLTENGVLHDKWTDMSNLNSKELRIEDDGAFNNGTTVVLAVKKTNAAGLSTIGYSNGITLDNTAGKIEKAEFTLRDKPKEEIVYHYTNDRDITLWVSGYDEQSGITKIVAELGYFDNGNWITYNKSGINEVSANGKIDITLPDSVSNSDRFRYKIVWYNGSNTASQPFFSRALVYNPAIPKITDIEGFYHNGLMSVSWNSQLDIPLKSGIVSLFSAEKGLIREKVITENRGVCYFRTDISGSEIEDGEYFFNVELVDYANGSPVVMSNSFVKDTRSPYLESFEADSFVAKAISFSLHANENISNYSFKLGTVENDSAFTSEWVEGINSGKIVKIRDYDLTQFEALKNIDQSVMQIKIRFSDSAGNWSENETGLVVVDLTPPETPVVQKSRDITFFDSDFTLKRSIGFFNTSLKKINWNSKDNLSRVTGYSWSVVHNRYGLISDNQWSEVLPVDDSGSYQVELKNLSLSDGEEVYVVLRSVNGAGLFSKPAYSDAILIDLKGPQATFSVVDEVGTTNYEGVAISTYNMKGKMKLNIVSEASDLTWFQMTLKNPSGMEILKKTDYINTAVNPGDYELLFNPEEGVYGRYTVNIELFDPGMNRTTIERTIRHNSPPFPETPDRLESNPGRPFCLDGFNWFKDTDGISRLDYTVFYGDSKVWSQSVSVNNETEISLLHTAPENRESVYQLSVTAFDTLGASTEVNIPVVIKNTQKGQLYTNEFWSEKHILEGSVTVPSGITLTLKENTLVEIDTGAINGYDQRILIEEGASLIHLGQAQYINSNISGNWEGLVIEGAADLNDLTIIGANRAITIDSNQSFNITNTIIKENVIGLHLINSSGVVIDNSQFTHNEYYGIKEESGENPVVINTVFNNNGFDYYDFRKTVINYEELNHTDSNYGNRGE